MSASVNLAGPKLIYFARRHPTLDAAGFARRWRQHGALGMSLPRWRNVAFYAQCDRIAPGGDSDLADCDGVAVVVFRSEAARRAHISDPEGAVTRADEAHTFAAPVRDSAVLTASTELRPHVAGLPRLFLAVTRPDGQDPERFAAFWRDEIWPGLAGQSAGHTGNQARAEGPNGAGVDFVDEITTSSPAAMIALIRRRAPHIRLAAIATRMQVLHDVTA